MLLEVIVLEKPCCTNMCENLYIYLNLHRQLCIYIRKQSYMYSAEIVGVVSSQKETHVYDGSLYRKKS